MRNSGAFLGTAYWNHKLAVYLGREINLHSSKTKRFKFWNKFQIKALLNFSEYSLKSHNIQTICQHVFIDPEILVVISRFHIVSCKKIMWLIISHDSMVFFLQNSSRWWRAHKTNIMNTNVVSDHFLMQINSARYLHIHIVTIIVTQSNGRICLLTCRMFLSRSICDDGWNRFGCPLFNLD